MGSAKKKAVRRDVAMKQVAYRLPTPLLDRVDEWAREAEQSEPGLQLSQTDAVRMLLERSLTGKES